MRYPFLIILAVILTVTYLVILLTDLKKNLPDNSASASKIDQPLAASGAGKAEGI